MELFGYLGSAMVVISMLMSSVVKLRIINMIGSLISGIYALIIGSLPLALMNVCLVIINLYNLRKLLFTKQQYDLVKCNKDDPFVKFFLDYYKEDISIYFPKFDEEKADYNFAYMVMCKADPAGVIIGNRNEAGELEIQLEYTTATYRDCSIGKYLLAAFPALEVTKLKMQDVSDKHKPYLEKMGYALHQTEYTKNLQ